MSRLTVEVLTFAGCPNRQPALDLVERVVAELAVPATVREVEVADQLEARERCFLGSPSVHVDGYDIEPGAAERRDYSLSCRVYRTPAGVRGLPDEQWLRTVLLDRS